MGQYPCDHHSRTNCGVAGIRVVRLAVEKHPSIQTFCADAGRRKTFEADVAGELGCRVDISEKGMGYIIPMRWKVERAFGSPEQLQAAVEGLRKKVASSQAICAIASIAIIVRRF